MRGSHSGPGPGLALALVLCGRAPPPSPSPSAAAAAASAPTSPSPEGTSQAATPSPVAFEPTYEVVDCPETSWRSRSATSSAAISPCCEDRSDPTGATIRLFATKTDPPGGTTTPDPAFGGAGDLGADSGPSDDSAGAQRIHRAVYTLDIRGHDRSGPDLDCPEVRAAGPTLAGLRSARPRASSPPRRGRHRMPGSPGGRRHRPRGRMTSPPQSAISRISDGRPSCRRST